MYKKYLNNRSYENKRNVKKIKIALKLELKRCEVEDMDEMAEDLEMQPDGIIVYKILYWHVKKLRRNS